MSVKTLSMGAILLPLTALLISGCNWVKPQEGSDQVKLAAAGQVSDCRKLGHTTSFVKHEVAGLPRNPETVAEELVTLGKNQAVDMGGNTLVQTSAPKAGKAGFDIYRCP